MSKSKRIFWGLAAVFLVLLLFASYDIARRTTFPGSRPQLKERIEKEYLEKEPLMSDSIRSDSTRYQKR